MSGPKVVRVVTREELVAQSMAIATRLQEALNRWRNAAQEAGELNDGDLAQTELRHEQIRSALKADKFAQFNQAANREIAFLASDLEQRRELAATRRANRRKAQLQASQNARTLMQALRDKGATADAQVMQVIEHASRGKGDMQAVEAALAAGFRMLALGERAPSVSQAQRELVARLADAGTDVSFAEWKAVQEKQKPAVDDPRIESIARQLEVLQLLHEDAAVIGAFEQRLEQCVRLPSSGRESMQLDSLVMELSAAVRDAKNLEVLEDEAASVLAELSALGDGQAVEAQVQLRAALRERSGASIQQGTEAGRAVLAASVKADAARARRAAVLQGLAKLGYAVHEGMETAWVEAGRVVIQKPSLDGYGVELAGAADAERLQVRTVALVQERDTSRDTDAEHLWCSDFAKLKDDLALAGSNVFVDKALGVGAVPLKVAQITGLHASGRTAAGGAKAAS